MIDQLNVATNCRVFTGHGVQCERLNQREAGWRDRACETANIGVVTSLDGGDAHEFGNVKAESEDLNLRTGVVERRNLNVRHLLDVVKCLTASQDAVCISTHTVSNPHAVEQRVRESDAALNCRYAVAEEQERKNIILHGLVTTNLNTRIKHVVAIERVGRGGEAGCTTARNGEVLNVR